MTTDSGSGGSSAKFATISGWPDSTAASTATVAARGSSGTSSVASRTGRPGPREVPRGRLRSGRAVAVGPGPRDPPGVIQDAASRWAGSARGARTFCRHRGM